jgi:hypothetical protein
MTYVTAANSCACYHSSPLRGALQGHIKLSDFGLCTGLKQAHRTDFYRPVTAALCTNYRAGCCDVSLTTLSCLAQGKQLSMRDKKRSWKAKRRALVRLQLVLT